MDDDLARIAFVTRRYQELKGLHSVAFGSALLCGVLLQTLVAQSLRGADASATYSLATLAVMVSMSRFEPLYRAAFGSSRPKSWLDALGVLATSPPLLLVWGMLLDKIAEGRWGGPSLAAVMLAAGASIVVIRDFRWRPYYAAPLVAAMAAIAITPTKPAGLLSAYAWMTVGVIVSGFYDHRLLVSAMGRSRAAEPPVRKTAATLRAHARVAALVSVGAGVLLPLPTAFVYAAFMLAFVAGSFLVLMSASPGLRSRTDVIGLRTQVLGIGEEFEETAPDAKSPVVLPSTAILAAVVALAIGAAADASRPGTPPVFLELAFACSAVVAALTAWPRRRRYLLGIAASALAFVIGAHWEPIRAFALFVCAVAAAVAIGTLFEEPGRARRMAPSQMVASDG